MRIVSWNCQMGFRTKWKQIAGLEADVLIIPECENPGLYPFGGFLDRAGGYVWTGDIKWKGLCVFSKSNVKLEPMPWGTTGCKHILPVLVDGSYLIVAVWTAKEGRYIRNYMEFHGKHDGLFPEKTIVMGDFNSNPAFKDKGLARLHPQADSMLKQKGLVSLYHHATGEKMGSESTHTYFWRRKRTSGSQNLIDYCYTRPDIVRDFQVLDNDSWLSHSDHFPLLLDLK